MEIKFKGTTTKEDYKNALRYYKKNSGNIKRRSSITVLILSVIVGICIILTFEVALHGNYDSYLLAAAIGYFICLLAFTVPRYIKMLQQLKRFPIDFQCIIDDTGVYFIEASSSIRVLWENFIKAVSTQNMVLLIRKENKFIYFSADCFSSSKDWDDFCSIAQNRSGKCSKCSSYLDKNNDKLCPKCGFQIPSLLEDNN